MFIDGAGNNRRLKVPKVGKWGRNESLS